MGPPFTAPLNGDDGDAALHCSLSLWQYCRPALAFAVAGATIQFGSVPMPSPNGAIRDTPGRAQRYRYILWGANTRGRSFVYITRNSICRRRRAL